MFKGFLKRFKNGVFRKRYYKRRLSPMGKNHEVLMKMKTPRLVWAENCSGQFQMAKRGMLYIVALALMMLALVLVVLQLLLQKLPGKIFLMLFIRKH